MKRSCSFTENHYNGNSSAEQISMVAPAPALIHLEGYPMEYALKPNSGGIDVSATLTCGQVFQWHRLPDGRWAGVIRDTPVQVWQEADTLHCRTVLPPDRLRAYFRLDDDLDEIYGAFPEDALLQQAVSAFRGMRIVQQDTWECLLSFLCATNANIPRIRQMIAALCRGYGQEVDDGLFTFPAPASLAEASESDLRNLRLGYRARYIQQAACLIQSGEFDLEELQGLDYSAAHMRLCALPGVGPKVADCVCLFSLGWLRAVPVDTWVRKLVQAREPSLRSYRAMADFARHWLGPYAGYAQQYLFHYVRTLGNAPGERRHVG
jgi:N-glycosylase/DNA lyase